MSVTTLTVPLTPPSLNTWLSTGYRLRHREKQEWELLLSGVLNGSGDFARLAPHQRVEAEATFRFADKRKRDVDNYAATLWKCLGDSLRPRFIPDDHSAHFGIRSARIDAETGPAQTTIDLHWEA